jgi:hypothetical protein
MTGAEMLLGQGADNVDEQVAAAPVKETKPALSETERALRAELKQIKAERAQANQRAAEAENTARFWHGKAQATPVAAKKEEESDPADFIEQLTARGTAAIDDHIAKRGYVSKDEVEARIAAARNQVIVESNLAREYPDLADSESAFFKETAAQYQALIAETPELKGNPNTMKLAAKLAAAEFEPQDEQPVRKARKASPVEEDLDDDVLDEDEDTPEARETSRVRRVQSQSVTGRRTRRDANEDTLDPMQKSIVANLRAAGSNISEESLIKRIQGGTKLSGRIGMAAAAMGRTSRRRS